jgi:lipopolysaccharide/colanic/teichoic acid biosynthesis glycosyltransferase
VPRIAVKRFLDIIVSLLGLIAICPLLLGIALWVKVDSPGPVFYRGKRAGRGGKAFGIFKFRSMVVNADKLGGPSTSDSDPRVTRSGRFIRRFKLDELAQLINVLLGDMSLVGPRPQVLDYVETYYTPEEKEVLKVRPGITDWASIWGLEEGAFLAHFSDPDDAYVKHIHPTKLKLQLAYARSHTLWTDLKILACTMRRMLRADWLPPELEPYGRLMDRVPKTERQEVCSS